MQSRYRNHEQYIRNYARSVACIGAAIPAWSMDPSRAKPKPSLTQAKSDVESDHLKRTTNVFSTGDLQSIIFAGQHA